MLIESKEHLMEDIFSHPHAEIVRGYLDELVNKIVNSNFELSVKDSPQENPPEVNCPRMTRRVQIKVGDYHLEPMSIKFEKRKCLEEKKKNTWMLFDHDYITTVRSLPFFKECGYESYSWEDKLTQVRPLEFISDLIDTLKLLNPYCMFKAHPTLPMYEGKNQGSLSITICLLQEYDGTLAYDFSATIKIVSAKEAIRHLQKYISLSEEIIEA